MRHFEYSRADSVEQAIATYSGSKDASFLAGGTNLLDMVKLDIMRPELMVDVNRLQLGQVEELDDGRLKVGAMVSNAATTWALEYLTAQNIHDQPAALHKIECICLGVKCGVKITQRMNAWLMT